MKYHTLFFQRLRKVLQKLSIGAFRVNVSIEAAISERYIDLDLHCLFVDTF